MILYSINTTRCESGGCAPLYPDWVRYENYDQCDGFCREYAALEKKAAPTLFSKAGSLLKSLGRLFKEEGSAGAAPAEIK